MFNNLQTKWIAFCFTGLENNEYTFINNRISARGYWI